MMHLERFFAPAVRNADMALFFPARVLRTEARAVAANMPGRSFAGTSNLLVTMMRWGKVL